MDEYGNDDGWTSNYDENAYYSPDDQYQSVASVSEDSSYDLPNTYGYGQNDLGSWGPSQEADDSLYNYQSDYPTQGYDMPGQGNFLSQLFGGSTPNIPNAPNDFPNQSGSTSSFLSQLFGGGSKLLGALMEGKQNKKYANNLGNMSKQIQTASDPFGSQRPFYQQQAQQAVTDPYASPLVRMQTDELLRQANIGGAAHGRSRIQNLSPALLAEQAKIAMGYQEQMARQGGYQMKPDTGSMAAALMGGAKADASGYGSPLASAFGNIIQTNQNQTNLDSILNALKAQRGN